MTQPVGDQYDSRKTVQNLANDPRARHGVYGFHLGFHLILGAFSVFGAMAFTNANASHREMVDPVTFFLLDSLHCTDGNHGPVSSMIYLFEWPWFSKFSSSHVRP